MIISKKEYDERIYEIRKEYIGLEIENDKLKERNKELENEIINLLKQQNKTINIQQKLLDFVEKLTKKRK